jgi:hypothetical protein
MILKKFKFIVKVGNNEDGSAKCLKYRDNDLKKFTQFLDREHKGWRWFNVYNPENDLQVANYTNKNRPTTKHLEIS